MPDLMPDTSFYPHPQNNSLSLLDLLNVAKGAQDYQSQQSMTQALSGARDPNTGQVDYSKALQAFQQSPGFKTPGQFSALQDAASGQINLREQRLSLASQYLEPLLAFGPKITSRQVTAAMPAIASALGPDAAATVHAIVGDAPDGPELFNRLLIAKQAMVRGGTTYEEVPQGGGLPPKKVPAGAAERQAYFGTAGVPGLQSTEEPPDFKTEREASGTYLERTQPLVQAISSARKLGPDAFYPGSDELNQFKKFAVGVGLGKTLGIDVNNIDSYDKVRKALADWTNRISAGGTNDRLAATIESNPNTTMRNATLQSVAKVNLALEARRNAIYQEFTQTGLPPSAFGAFRARFNQEYDPRAFTFPMMSPQARSTLLKGMSRDEYARFSRSEALASKYIRQPPEGGWYTPQDEPK